MKKTLFYVLFAVATVTFWSCAKTGDIDELQDQIDRLETKITQVEAAQQSALLSEISTLMGLITTLQSQTGDLSDDYDVLLVSLTLLSDEIAAGENVFYGNALTDEDFAEVLAEGITVITGDVVVKSQSNVDALATVKMIGGNLLVNGGNNIVLSALEGIAGDLSITGVSDAGAVVSLASLMTIGGDVEIEQNGGITLIEANDLVLINGDLSLDSNLSLTTLSMSKLNMIDGNLDIYEMNPDNWDFNNAGSLVTLDLSSTDVSGNVTSGYLGVDSELLLGNVGGNLDFNSNSSKKIEILSVEFEGTITIANNGTLETISFPNMTKVGGDINVQWNVAGGFIGAVTSKLTDLSCFDNITEVGGNIDIAGNSFPSLDAFNSVLTVRGGNISLAENGQVKTLVNVFNSLEGTGSWSKMNISITEKTDWFTGFEALTAGGNIVLRIVVTQDENWNQGTVAKIDGFNALTTANILNFDASYATEVNAFPLLTDLTHWEEYLILALPKDNTVTICSMSELLTKIKNGEFDSPWNANKKATFIDTSYWQEVDRDTAIDTLLNGCN